MASPITRRAPTGSISSTTSVPASSHSARPSLVSVSTPTTANRRNTLNSITSGSSITNNNTNNAYQTALDPNASNTPSLLNASVLEFLLIEMVPLARRVVADVKEMNTPKGPEAVAAALAAEKKKIEKSEGDSEIKMNTELEQPADTLSNDQDAEMENKDEGENETNEAENTQTPQNDVEMEDSDLSKESKNPFSLHSHSLTREQLHQYPNMASIEDEDVFFRTELYGYRVGRALAEVVTRDMARLTNQLSVLKFVCKELWVLVYGKPIDNLKTNHRGTYVLIDNNFQPCERMGSAGNLPLRVFYGTSGTNNGQPSGQLPTQNGLSTLTSSSASASSSVSAAGTMSAAAPFIWFPLGIIRGALAALGVESTVSFVATQSPTVSFNVHTTNIVKR